MLNSTASNNGNAGRGTLADAENNPSVSGYVTFRLRHRQAPEVDLSGPFSIRMSQVSSVLVGLKTTTQTIAVEGTSEVA